LVKDYYQLAKPGIIYGNALTASAGFLLASKGHIRLGLFLAMLGGLSLIIASACAFNNYIDRSIDAKMKRTRNRALVSRAISAPRALVYASFLGIAGAAILGLYTNWLALLVALGAFFVYVVLYGIWKRRTAYGTLIGALAGAAPPVVGYSAAAHRLDGGALILFLILMFWQMPHFLAISIYRFKDYKAASLPVWPVKKGLPSTKVNMLAYVIAFMAATTALFIFGYAGIVYLVVATALGLAWLWRCAEGFTATDDQLWARGVFRFSLVVITLLSVMIAVDAAGR